MAKDLNIRGVPDDIHRILVARADASGMSLRRYVIELFENHAKLPTMDEWLASVAKLERVDGPIDAAKAVRESREEDEEHLIRGLPRR